MKNFQERLKGGHPNSLGNTVEVVEEVLADHLLFDDLFTCYFSEDQVVRLRVSNAMKRICKSEKSLLLPYVDRFLTEIAEIDQASTQWTLSQLFLQLEHDLSPNQKMKAIRIMKENIAKHHDWIVLCQTMDTLGKWATKNRDLKDWLAPHLFRLSRDTRKSVSKKAEKMIGFLDLKGNS